MIEEIEEKPCPVCGHELKFHTTLDEGCYVICECNKCKKE